MALSRVKTWNAAETLTASDLNAEFNNICNHFGSLTNADIDSTASYVMGELVVGTGITSADGGQLHVHTATAGTIQAVADADEAVFENSGASGITILSGATSTGNIAFGDSGDADNGLIKYTHGSTPTLGVTVAATAVQSIAAAATTLAHDLEIYQDVNNADSAIKIGTSATEALFVEALNGASNKTLEELRFTTKTASGTANHGKMSFYVDDAEIATVDDSGISLASGKSIAGATNITLSGELDAGSLDVSGDADIDGTLEADAITLGGTALGSLYSPIAGSSSIVTTGALNSGSITSGFGTINNGSSTITTTGALSAGATTVTSLNVSDGSITNVNDIAVDTISGDADTNTTIGFPGSDVLTFSTGGTEALRADASQRVLVGTTSTYNADYDNLVVASTANTGVTIASTSTTATTGIAFADGTDSGNNTRAGLTYDHNAGLLKINSNNATAMVFDTSQRVGIGTDSPATGAVLHVAHGNTSNTNPELLVKSTLTGNANSHTRAQIESGGGDAALTLYDKSNYWTMAVDQSNSSRLDIGTGQWVSPKLSITTGGSVTVETSLASGHTFNIKNPNATNPSGMQIYFGGTSSGDTTDYFYIAGDSGATRAINYSNGNWVNANNSYGSTSDVKLKQDIVDARNYWDDFKALRYRKFRLKEEVAQDANAGTKIGLIAEEIEGDFSKLVDEEPDREMQILIVMAIRYPRLRKSGSNWIQRQSQSSTLYSTAQ